VEDPARAAALRVARRAAAEIPAYAAHLARHGLAPDDLRDLAAVPVLDRAGLAGAAPADWCPGGEASAAAEWVSSSGSSGRPLVTAVGAAERRALGRMVDRSLEALGVGPAAPGLLVNALPGGVALPARLAAVATPGTRPDLVLEVIRRAAPVGGRVVLVGDPLLLKEVAEQGAAAMGPGWAPRGMHVIVGGEWVAESWRRRFAALTGLGDDPGDPAQGALISMGAAELGLHVFAETPVLRVARALLVDPRARRALLGRDPGYAPELLAYDPRRVLVEERPRPGGARELVVTTLASRLVPLVRYAPGDQGEHVAPGALARLLAAAGLPGEPGPVLAVWGRVGALAGDGWSLRPEPVKEALFAMEDAGRLTGRFRLATAAGRPVVHVQFRDAADAPPRLARDLAAAVGALAGVPAAVVLHACRAYPWHPGADFQRKPVYLDPGGER
jgi:hypothetical protein